MKLLLFEQLIGGVPMAHGVGKMLLDTGDFGPEQLNSFIELVDRQGAKVLFDEQAQGVLRLAGKEVILVHARNR